MVGSDSDTNNSPSQNNNTNSHGEYLARALQARNSGDVVLALHLYLAAYERSLQETNTPDDTVVEGLRQAWDLAVDSKERSLAEYIFEKLEPYLAADEITQNAEKLQRLALDKLEEFGVSREDLEDMTDMISQDFLGLDPSSFFMRVEQADSASNAFSAIQRGLVRGRQEKEKNNESIKQTSELSVSKDLSDEVKSVEVTDNSQSDSAAADNAQEAESNKKGVSDIQKDAEKALSGLKPIEGAQGLFSFVQPANADKANLKQTTPHLTYCDLVGYQSAIDRMRRYGIGMNNDPDFKKLVQDLNEKHGLDRIPITDSFLVRSPIREDANQFLLATMGEIGLPTIRMRMEENLQGLPVLCVMTAADNQPRFNVSKSAIEGGGILILEDVDLWGMPLLEAQDDMGGFMFSQLSRGAREALNLVRAAIESPEVYVLVSAAKDSQIDPFFCDLLDPMTIIDIDLPTIFERADLWSNIVKEHPSLRQIDRGQLVRYTEGMSRFDIYMAAREAVEAAYKESLVSRKYVSVSAELIFEKIAAFQPLESDQYKQLEDAVIDMFGSGLDDISSLWEG